MYKVCEVFILIFVVFIGNFSQKLKSVAELKQVLHGDLGPGQLYPSVQSANSFLWKESCQSAVADRLLLPNTTLKYFLSCVI